MATQQQSAETVEHMFQRAFALHGEGDHAGARKIYERILSTVPRHPGALQMLASLAYYKGDAVQAEAYRDAAIKSYRGAIAQIPKDQLPAIMNLRAGLMNLLLSADQVEDAETEAEKLRIPLVPQFVSPEEWMALRQDAVAKQRPRMVINTIPKSASETVWNRLAKGLGMAQCHVSLGLFPHCVAVPARIHAFAQGGIITKEHLAPTAFNLRCLTRAGLDRIVINLRDPRQIVLSWAYFVRDEISRTPLGPLWRQTCPPASVLNSDFAALLDWCVDHYLPQVVAFMEGWQRIESDTASGLQVLFTTFEDFRADPPAYFQGILAFHDTPLDSFDTAAEAQDGHLRRGETDEWRSVFTAAQKKRANAAIGEDLLARFGWQR